MKKIGMLVIAWLLATGLAFAQVNINTAKKTSLTASRASARPRRRRSLITGGKMARSRALMIYRMCPASAPQR